MWSMWTWHVVSHQVWASTTMTVTHGNSYLCPSRTLEILPISLFPRAHSRAQKISDGVHTCACVCTHTCVHAFVFTSFPSHTVDTILVRKWQRWVAVQLPGSFLAKQQMPMRWNFCSCLQQWSALWSRSKCLQWYLSSSLGTNLILVA